jgi:hypothetical protein
MQMVASGTFGNQALVLQKSFSDTDIRRPHPNIMGYSWTKPLLKQFQAKWPMLTRVVSRDAAQQE